MSFNSAKGAGRRWYTAAKIGSSWESGGDRAIREICVQPYEMATIELGNGRRAALYKSPINGTLVWMDSNHLSFQCWIPTEQEAEAFLQECEEKIAIPV